MFVTDASGRALRFCQQVGRCPALRVAALRGRHVPSWLHAPVQCARPCPVVACIGLTCGRLRPCPRPLQCTRLHPLTEFEGSKRSCAVSLQRRMERKHRQKRAAERADGGGAAAGGTRRTRGASSARPSATYLPGSSSADGSSPSGASPSTSGGGAAHLSQHSGGHSGLSAGNPAAAYTPGQPFEPQLSLGMPPAHAPAYVLPSLGGETASAGTPATRSLSDQAAAAQYQQQDLLRQRQQQAQLIAEAEAQAALNGWVPSGPAPAPAAGLRLGAGVGAPLQPYGGLQGVVPTNTQPGSAWTGAAVPQPQQAGVPSLTPDEIDQLLVSGLFVPLTLDTCPFSRGIMPLLPARSGVGPAGGMQAVKRKERLDVRANCGTVMSNSSQT